MASTKDITRRIKSVNSTKKITKAMEMVAAAKMRRATEAVLRTRAYADLSWAIALNLSRLTQNGSNRETIHPLLAKRAKVKRVGVVLITSNRGLCGGYNTAIINKAHRSIVRHQAKGEIGTDFILVGKKGAAVYKYYNYNIAAQFPKVDIASEVKEITPVSRLVVESFLNGTYDKIMLAYTDYVSAAKQIPRVKQLLPVDITAQEEYLGLAGESSKEGAGAGAPGNRSGLVDSAPDAVDYTFEPNPPEVLGDMIPRLIDVQLFQALLEANASEHSARMTAMHQANDAATDMIHELTLYYNKARQAAITAEIAEISAGANALV
ncbi:MAG: ATP synthase F1 subunit gamma [Planctomycetes bacterium]|jgi:F-type H+-transporting ATPase subunit gamma|nr:ATP synthase F1 subunit gamma [Planctomycetota bacterium]